MSEAIKESTVVRLSPEDAVEAFLKPRPPRSSRALVLADGKSFRISTPQGAIGLQRDGTGPAVLLVHGWEGQASDMAPLANGLRTAGFSVTVMHLPAHGDSAGTQTSLPESARALHSVGRVLGPFHAVVAHSMGAAILAEALHLGLEASRVVMISAPARYEHYVRRFATQAGLDAEETHAMLDILSTRTGTNVRDVSVPGRAPGLIQPALFIHSADDRAVPIEDSLASAAAWPGARHVRVERLGHMRLLSDPMVVAETVGFLTNRPFPVDRSVDPFRPVLEIS